MAKGKHAAALFEVIHSGKKPPRASLTGGIPTPRWWFKGRAKSETESAPRVIQREIVEEPPTPMRIAADNPMMVDPDAGEIKFKLSYAGVAAAGFVLIMILAIAYLVGTRSTQVGMADHPTPGNPTAADPSLLAAVTPETVDAAPTPTPTLPAPAPIAKDVDVPENVPTKPVPAPAAAAPILDKTGRQVGLNYIIVQSYPDAAAAQKACDFLNKSGIPCSVEQVPRWSWPCVVSMKGFAHVKANPELDDYKKKIETLGETFAGRSQFNRFHPLLTKWQAAEQQ